MYEYRQATPHVLLLTLVWGRLPVVYVRVMTAGLLIVMLFSGS